MKHLHIIIRENKAGAPFALKIVKSIKKSRELLDLVNQEDNSYPLPDHDPKVYNFIPSMKKYELRTKTV